MDRILDTTFVCGPHESNGDAIARRQPDKDWQKTPYSNRIRYVPSGSYYARLRVKGKLIRRSLKADVLSVAKLRLSDFEKHERQLSESGDATRRGRITVGEAVEIYKQRKTGDASLKPRTFNITKSGSRRFWNPGRA